MNTPTHPKLYQTTRRVEFVDTDMAGIVHFSNFFRYMEFAEVELLHSLGLSVRLGWEGQEMGFPRVAASCDYLKPVRFEDVLAISVRLIKLGGKSITYGFEFRCEGQLIAKGQTTCVCCRILPNREIASIEIPQTLRAKFADYVAAD